MSDEPVRILVVDDERGMREGCRRILAAEGYEVETAEDGLMGLEIFEKRRNFAAALIDLKMPRMDGIHLIKSIRKQDEDIVLLVITAYAAIETAVEATKCGAYNYIPKPFTPEELLLPVRNGLERRTLAMEAKRLRAERDRRLVEVAHERSRSHTIIFCMTDGILVVNRDGQVVLRNAAAARVIPLCDLLPIPGPLAALHCDALTALLNEAITSASAPVIVSREIAFGPNTFMVNASPVVEPSGETLGAVAVFRDITARKKLEEAKSMFVSMVAHEIKSPLAAVEGYLNILLGGETGEASEKGHKIMERCLVRITALRTMVSDLMNLTAIETGHIVVRRSPLDIRKVLEEVLDPQKEKAREKQIEIRLECPRSVEPILADHDAIFSVLTNLVDNAVKYTPDRGHVRISVGHNGLYVRVTIQDDGIGMTPEEKEKVFEEFFRAKNDYTAQVPGTGLGLTLVKRLVELHEGRISVESSPGKGSTFTLDLPVSSEAGPR